MRNMKINARGPNYVELDYTPMIDMTFQLIAFFMIVINFEAADQDQQVQLPESVLARPPETAFDDPITIQMVADGRILMGGDYYADAEAIRPLLKNELFVLQSRAPNEAARKRRLALANVIIRADRDAEAGRVQDIVAVCQEVGFEKFTLRARVETEY
jgi:biopolymer transport protein ExbD